MTLAKSLKRKKKSTKRRQPKRKGPLWKGPEVDGITQSMLSRFLVCRERFRLLVVEGLRPADTFNHRMEYGSMWHVCEEAFAGKLYTGGLASVESALKQYCQELCKKYPLQQEQIQHWYNVCKMQFPIYVGYWAKHKDVKSRTPLLQEQVFDVPYKLPSGRIVRLRGKWDSVDLIGKGKSAGIWSQENKTKGDINEEQMKRQLQFDLQTMIYLIALVEFPKDARPVPFAGGELIPPPWKPDRVRGVRYNVVRRPLAGGKNSIRQHKPTKANPMGESLAEFYRRLGGLIREDPEWYFMRWQVTITAQDIERFKREFLSPILEQLCNWWEWISYCLKNGYSPFTVFTVDERSRGTELHWRTPYGFWNVLAEGGSSELDEYLATGSTLGLERVDTLFRELV